MRVLVVEGEADIRLVLLAALEGEGWTVVVVDGGRRALTRLTDEPFDAVLLDVMLPDVDGVSTLLRLRTGGSPNAGVAVVMLTALDEPTLRTDALRHGADAYVTKPLAVEELLALLREVVGRDGTRRLAARQRALACSRRSLATA